MSRPGLNMAGMRARFRGGALDGREFTVGEPPPRGLDVEHDGRVLRYGMDGRAETGEAIYGFVTRRWAFGRTGALIYLDGQLHATALPFYPTVPKSDDSPLGF